MTSQRLPWLVAVMVVLLVLRWWFPPGGQSVESPRLVPAIVRAQSPARSESDAATGIRDSGTAREASAQAPDIPANAFAVRAIKIPPPSLAPPTPKTIAFVGPPQPPQPPPPAPPPPPPPIQVIGNWDDGVAPGVFVYANQTTTLARVGTVLLTDYRVSAISAQQVTVMHNTTQQVWQIPVPRGIGNR